MKGQKIISLITEMANGRAIATGTQNPFSLPNWIKESVDKEFSLSVDWDATLSADQTKYATFIGSDGKPAAIGSFQVVFHPANKESGFTARVSLGAFAELVLNDKPALTCKTSEGKKENADGKKPIYYNIEAFRPVAVSPDLYKKVLETITAMVDETSAVEA